VSAEAKIDNPQSELKPEIDLLGYVDEIFYDTYDRYEPVNEPSLKNCFVLTLRFAVYNTWFSILFDISKIFLIIMFVRHQFILFESAYL
jgi:hypothetical protein